MAAKVQVGDTVITVLNGDVSLDPLTDNEKLVIVQTQADLFEPEGYTPNIDNALAAYLASELNGKVIELNEIESKPDTIY